MSLKVPVIGRVVDRSIVEGKQGKKYHNLYILQDGQRSSQQVGVTQATYDSVQIGDDVTISQMIIYANVSGKGNAFLSVNAVD